MNKQREAPLSAQARDEVMAQMEAGKPFDQVEAAIDEIGDLTEDAKAALWLLAFSIRDRGDQVREAHA